MNDNLETNQTDKYLVNKILKGDVNAFGVIIKNTERLVAQIVFKMVNDTEDRKDIAQDTYLKVFRNLSTFKFQSKLSTWIAQIAYNTCLSHLEKKKLVSLPLFYERREEEDKDYEDIINPVNRYTEEAEKFIFQKELSAILKLEIDQLPPLYKTLITLYHNEELNYAEIAQITALPEGTLKSYLFRARKALKEKLLLKYKNEAL